MERRDTGALTAYVILSIHDRIENFRLADGLTCMNKHVGRPGASLYTKVSGRDLVHVRALLRALVVYVYLELGLESRGRDLVYVRVLLRLWWGTSTYSSV